MWVPTLGSQYHWFQWPSDTPGHWAGASRYRRERVGPSWKKGCLTPKRRLSPAWLFQQELFFRMANVVSFLMCRLSRREIKNSSLWKIRWTFGGSFIYSITAKSKNTWIFELVGVLQMSGCSYMKEKQAWNGSQNLSEWTRKYPGTCILSQSAPDISFTS